jgi:hypothetical protein
MTFRMLADFLEERMGSHQFPLNPDATSPRDLFSGCALHEELSKQLLRDIYKRNRCHHLDDEIRCDFTEAVLMDIRNGLLANNSGMDIDKYNYVEDVCQVVSDFFRSGDPAAKLPADVQSRPRSAEIIDINRYRLRRLKWRA